MNAIDVLINAHFERCIECNCNVGDDWEYKDYTCKGVIICPQCGEEYYIDEIDAQY